MSAFWKRVDAIFSRQFLGLLIVGTVAIFKPESMSWYLVAIYGIYVLANQLQKHFPAILEIIKAKFTKGG